MNEVSALLAILSALVAALVWMVKATSARSDRLIERRRAEQSQREAAAVKEVSLYRFRRWESGDEAAPAVDLGDLEPYEACFLRRRRAGVSLKDLADAMNVSRWWLCQMEYGRAGSDRLVEHWAGVTKPWRPVVRSGV